MAQPKDLTAAGGPRAAPEPAQAARPNVGSPRTVPAEAPTRPGTASPRTVSAEGPTTTSTASPRTVSSGTPSSQVPPTDEARGTSAATTVDAQQLAERAVEALFARDMASRTLGMRVVGVKPGYARLTMTVRPDMVNGHRICHGGLIFTLADSAFAASCNSHNESTVAAAASIDFLAPAFEGDELSAEAHELWRSGRSGLYEITVTNQRGERIALFRGRSHRVGGSLTTE
jgi:acyl-CoA thioesterase